MPKASAKKIFHFIPSAWIPGRLFLPQLESKDASAERRDVRYQLGGAVQRIARYPLRELRTGHSITYDVAANWKILMENYNECYHCGGIHPELCEIVPISSRREVLTFDG